MVSSLTSSDGDSGGKKCEGTATRSHWIVQAVRSYLPLGEGVPGSGGDPMATELARAEEAAKKLNMTAGHAAQLQRISPSAWLRWQNGSTAVCGQRQVPIELHGRLPARRQAPHGPPLFPNTSHHARVSARTAGKAKLPRDPNQPKRPGESIPGTGNPAAPAAASMKLPGKEGCRKATGNGKPAVADCSGLREAGR